MSGVLEGYEPKSVLHFFEKICSMPHGSGNTAMISDWIVAFAKERGLGFTQDIHGNVIIRKPASEGYENVPGMILQGHMDMVAVQTEKSPIDMEKDGLQLAVDGDFIYAKETSLGGDDGIAVAYMLAILDDETMAHPALEMVFTTDEEIGLQGISKMDVSSLKGKKLLNLDTEDEGILVAGCAGGKKAICSLPVTFTPVAGNCYKIQISGLLGGHSGMEIHKERGNANLLLARVLYEIRKECDFGLVNMQGGEKDNAIPNFAQAVIQTEASPIQLSQMIDELQQMLQKELTGKDDGIQLDFRQIAQEETVWVKQDCAVSGKKLDAILLCMLMNPNGVQAMSSSIEDTVETSLNCGIMKLRDDDFLVRYALRSSVRSAKAYLFDRINTFVQSLGGTVDTEGDYPPWEYQTDSTFREQVMAVYEQMYGKTMEVQVIHAGLECGYLSEQLPGLDCVSMGPDMKNIHTTNEKLSISSVKRVWEFIVELLKQK